MCISYDVYVGFYVQDIWLRIKDGAPLSTIVRMSLTSRSTAIPGSRTWVRLSYALSITSIVNFFFRVGMEDLHTLYTHAKVFAEDSQHGCGAAADKTNLTEDPEVFF